MNRFDEAQSRFERVLAIQERRLGADHPQVATALNNLAGIYNAQGRLAETEPLYQRSLVLLERHFGAEHPKVATTLANLADLYWVQKRPREALRTMRQATAILRRRAARAGGQRFEGSLAEQKSNRTTFLIHLKMISGQPELAPGLINESVEVAQLARATSTSGAVARMAARFATGDDRLARVVRARQDAVAFWQLLDSRLLEAAARPPAERDLKNEAELRRKLADLNDKLRQLGAIVGKEFPAYSELASARPATLPDIQGLLRPTEGLITFLVGDDEIYLWVVGPKNSQFRALDVSRPELEDMVEELRDGVDLSGAESLDDLPRFDSEVHLRDDATERTVKATSLSEYRVISFATHGLLAGELQGLPEPGLVMTPPENSSTADDGVLLASEIAQLKLNADWVVLSACNTASGEDSGAEGLSGLAKAFFYAGARTLLVSHWPVSSEATVELITRLFREAAHAPDISRAEALRRAQLALLATEDRPRLAHPAFWAPFVVVGESQLAGQVR